MAKYTVEIVEAEDTQSSKVLKNIDIRELYSLIDMVVDRSDYSLTILYREEEPPENISVVEKKSK